MITQKTTNTGQINEYYGLSTDTKPASNVPNASLFYEMDTSDIYMYDSASSEWLLQAGDSSSQSGDGLPDVTSSDDGNVLTVVNGSWDKALPNEKIKVINSVSFTISQYDSSTGEATVGNIVVDKTFNEMISDIDGDSDLFYYIKVTEANPPKTGSGIEEVYYLPVRLVYVNDNLYSLTSSNYYLEVSGITVYQFGCSIRFSSGYTSITAYRKAF